MKRAAIAIVDAARARLYTYQHDADSQEFVEALDLVSAGRRAKDGDYFTEASPGTRNVVGTRHGVDDHRNAHRDEMDSKFAAHVTSELERMANERGLKHVVFVTTPRMLGVVRPHLETLRKHGFLVDELERDLSKLTAPQIQDHLAQLDVIEPRRRAVQPRR
ncbi:MAG: host attachment protein [Kofleriaceae bacterium]